MLVLHSITLEYATWPTRYTTPNIQYTSIVGYHPRQLHLTAISDTRDNSPTQELQTQPEVTSRSTPKHKPHPMFLPGSLILKQHNFHWELLEKAFTSIPYLQVKKYNSFPFREDPRKRNNANNTNNIIILLLTHNTHTLSSPQNLLTLTSHSVKLRT